VPPKLAVRRPLRDKREKRQGRGCYGDVEQRFLSRFPAANPAEAPGLSNSVASALRPSRRRGNPDDRRFAIRSGEESVLCSTVLLRRGFISADFRGGVAARSAGAAPYYLIALFAIIHQ